MQFLSKHIRQHTLSIFLLKGTIFLESGVFLMGIWFGGYVRIVVGPVGKLWLVSSGRDCRIKSSVRICIPAHCGFCAYREVWSV